jgi:hypothetical protein
MADDRGGAGRREFLICRLNDNEHLLRIFTSLSKPSFDSQITFFEI